MKECRKEWTRQEKESKIKQQRASGTDCLTPEGVPGYEIRATESTLNEAVIGDVEGDADREDEDGRRWTPMRRHLFNENTGTRYNI